MDEEYYNHYESENYATIGHSPPWEILPIWLYLVSLTIRNPSLLDKKKTRKNLTTKADSPPLRPHRPPILPPLHLQTHPPNPLPLQPVARMQQPGRPPVRPRERPADGRARTRRPLDPLVRRVQRRGALRGDHAAALRERKGGGIDSGERVERGGGGGFCDVCLDDGAEGAVCW